MSILKRIACACVVAFVIGPNVSFAQNDIVFDIAALDGSSVQASILDASALFYATQPFICLLYTSPSPRDRTRSRMPSSA